MSARAHWYEDSRHKFLVVVVNPEERAHQSALILAYALAWQQDRILHLVVPEEMVSQTQARLAWVATDVRVWSHCCGHLDGPLKAQSRVEVLHELAALPFKAPTAYDLSAELKGWLQGIDLSGLDGRDRSCRSWHHDGLQVLRATQSHGGLRIQAGVQYHKPPRGREPYEQVFTAPPGPDDLAGINAAIKQAKEDGGSRTVGMREHAMQAQLDRDPGAIGLTRLWREYPPTVQ